LLTIDPSFWAQRSEDDRRRKSTYLTDGRILSYDEIEAALGAPYAAEATFENFTRQSQQGQAALDKLSAIIAEAQPDVLVIIGDDQEELFDKSHIPAVALFSGEEIVMFPRGQVTQNMPEWRALSVLGYAMDAPHRFPGSPHLASHVIRELVADGIDLSVASGVVDPQKAGFGHAFGFVLKRLCSGRTIPCVPVMINTYYPPNVPTPARCFEIGRSLAKAISRFPESCRVAIVASGGMTHFMNDEKFDRAFITALIEHDEQAICEIPVHALRSGTSELLNWIMLAGAMEAHEVTYSDYIPVRRTPVGTGIGLGFAAWSPRGK
jgi:hypothetical protein